jgi:hypothetical protein
MPAPYICLRYTRFSSSNGCFVTEHGIYARGGELLSCVCKAPRSPMGESEPLAPNTQQMYAPARILVGSGQERVSLIDYLRWVICCVDIVITVYTWLFEIISNALQWVMPVLLACAALHVCAPCLQGWGRVLCMFFSAGVLLQGWTVVKEWTCPASSQYNTHCKRSTTRLLMNNVWGNSSHGTTYPALTS